MTDTTQPEALWIAELFEGFRSCGHKTEDGRPLHHAAAAHMRRLHAECESLRHENHNLNWALGAPGYERMFTAEEQAESDAASAEAVEIIEGMKARKARHEALLPDGRDPLDEIESLRAQLAEAQAEARRFQILIDTAPGCLCFMGQDYRTGDEFRAAIDAFLMEPSK